MPTYYDSTGGYPNNPDDYRSAELNDVLTGTAGAETLDGAQGDDVYYVTPGDVLIDAGGIDTVYTGVDWILPAGFEIGIAYGSDPVRLDGNAAANVLVGNAADNSFAPGTGNDTIIGGGGIDTVYYAWTRPYYSVSGDPTVSGSISGFEGTDRLLGIERVKFLDGTLSFDPATH